MIHNVSYITCTDPISMASVISVVLVLLIVFLILVFSLLLAYNKQKFCFKGNFIKCWNKCNNFLPQNNILARPLPQTTSPTPKDPPRCLLYQRQLIIAAPSHLLLRCEGMQEPALTPVMHPLFTVGLHAVSSSSCK